MLEVYVYNAGKGDCLRVRFGEGHNILIDSDVMRFGVPFKKICEHILFSGETLDLLVLTHADDDHIGGILSLLRTGWRCPFTKVRMNHIGSSAFNAYLSVRQNDEVYRRLVSQNIQILPLLAGDQFCFSGVKITAISPAVILNDNTRINSPLVYQKDYGKSLSEMILLISAKQTAEHYIRQENVF